MLFFFTRPFHCCLGINTINTIDRYTWTNYYSNPIGSVRVSGSDSDRPDPNHILNPILFCLTFVADVTRGGLILIYQFVYYQEFSEKIMTTQLFLAKLGFGSVGAGPRPSTQPTQTLNLTHKMS